MSDPADLIVADQDLLDLLLEWGADPSRVCVSEVLDSYNSNLFTRYHGLGVDFTAGHELASALGYHNSNKPLFGWAKHHRNDPKIQKELDMALAHHANLGNEKGVQLCLWAGGNAHAPVPSLEFPDVVDEEDAEDGEDAFLGWSTVQEAAHRGHTRILERLGPDPAIDDFEDLY